jgi:hypothetical protein
VVSKQVFAERINRFVSGKLQDKDPTTDRGIYSSQDPYFNGLGKFIRNPDCWLNGVENISCFSPAQLSGANWWQRGGTLITRKHVLFAKHFTTSVITGGTPLIFVADDNTVIRRNIIQYASIPWTDVSVALLDAEVPANIKIAKVLPTNYADYLVFDSTSPVYCVGLDQQEKAIVKISTGGFGYIVSHEGESITYRMFSVNESSAAHQFQPFNETIVTGDSGNPVFLIIDNELVVATTWWTPTGGPFVSDSPVYAATNACIEQLSPGEGYALADINLQRAYENMLKLYFNPVSNDNQGDVNNWFQNSNFSVPAVNLPGNYDIPVFPWAGNMYRLAGAGGIF